MSTFTSGTSYPSTTLDGKRIWTDEHCGQEDFENYELSMEQWAGENIRFKFIAADKYQYTTTAHGDQGWFIDNVGIIQGNFSSPGSWISPIFNTSNPDDFNLGWIDIDSEVLDNTSINGSILDASSGNPIPGYEELDFPISLAGINPSYQGIKVEINLNSQNPAFTPILNKVFIGGERVLNPLSYDANGWDLSPNLQVVNGTIYSENISGTISSEFIPSIRPVSGFSVSGNFTSGIQFIAKDYSGNQIGSSTTGFTFPNPVNGYSLSISLPTNSSINSLQVSTIFSEHAKNPAIDILADGDKEWQFLFGDDYGHYGWQSTLSGGIQSLSQTITLDGINPQSALVKIPTNSTLQTGLIAVTSTSSTGFSGQVTVSVLGETQYAYRFTNLHLHHLSSTQKIAFSNLPTSHTDPDTNRKWSEIEIQINSNIAQTVEISRFGFGYHLRENVSQLTSEISTFQQNQNSNYPNLNIPASITTDLGSVNIDGNLDYAFEINNRNFEVPNTFYPRGTPYQVTTLHNHLYDNSELKEIILRGIPSEGNSTGGQVIEFKAINGQDGLWGSGSDTVQIIQTSGESLIHLDVNNTEVTQRLHNDGLTDIAVTWEFDISWNLDDVNSIRWVSMALNSDGETVWAASSTSGLFDERAIENDLQIVSFEIKDEFGRLLSNRTSENYPYWIKQSGSLNISGEVRFQDSLTSYPAAEDFLVGFNLSGVQIVLNSSDEGKFHGEFSIPSGIQVDCTNCQTLLYIMPELISIGPSSGSQGAFDFTQRNFDISVILDPSPPILGDLKAHTSIGLINANGLLASPTEPLNLSISLSDNQSLGNEINLHYWREDVDDFDNDGVADESEYNFQTVVIPNTGNNSQLIDFYPIDVSNQTFNSLVHFFLSGSDFAGWTYEDGNTGGGPGAENSWASMIIATNEPTQIVDNGYDLDSDNGYLLAGGSHTFTIQVSDLNGITSLESIDFILCDSLSNYSYLSYDPETEIITITEDSMLTPISNEINQINSHIFEVSISFSIDWSFPSLQENDRCTPSVHIYELSNQVVYRDFSELQWNLDHHLEAIPTELIDLTAPFGVGGDLHAFLLQGDQFSISGEVYYANTGRQLHTIPDGLQVQLATPIIQPSETFNINVNEDGTWAATLTTPYQISEDIIHVSTDLTSLPMGMISVKNLDATFQIDSELPTVDFSSDHFDEESLNYLNSDSLNNVTVSIEIFDDIGILEEDIQVSWLYLRGNQPIVGTQDFGNLSRLDSPLGSELYSGNLDFSPRIEDFSLQDGDKIAFWIVSTDKAGNSISGYGSESTPKITSVQILRFTPNLQYAYPSIENPPPDSPVLIYTFWSNIGNKDGTIEVQLYEITNGIDQVLVDNESLQLAAGASMQGLALEWISGDVGKSLLYIVIDNEIDNPTYVIGNITVTSPNNDADPELENQRFSSTEIMTLTILSLVISIIFLIALVIVRKSTQSAPSSAEEDRIWDEGVQTGSPPPPPRPSPPLQTELGEKNQAIPEPSESDSNSNSENQSNILEDENMGEAVQILESMIDIEEGNEQD